MTLFPFLLRQRADNCWFTQLVTQAARERRDDPLDFAAQEEARVWRDAPGRAPKMEPEVRRG